MKYACKHDFLDPHNLSRFHDHILIVMIFRISHLKFVLLLLIKVMS